MDIPADRESGEHRGKEEGRKGRDKNGGRGRREGGREEKEGETRIDETGEIGVRRKINYSGRIEGIRRE
jgi:hypothetical protein